MKFVLLPQGNEDAPTLTKSLRLSLETLRLDHLVGIYPGEKNYFLSETIEVIGLNAYLGCQGHTNNT